MSHENTLTFDSAATFYVEVGGEFLREDRPGTLRKGNTVQIQGIRGIFRVVDVRKERGKLQVEVEKIHGDALFWVRDSNHNVYPVEAVCMLRPNDPKPYLGDEYLIPRLGWISAHSVTECADPTRAPVSNRSRNPVVLPKKAAKPEMATA